MLHAVAPPTLASMGIHVHLAVISYMAACMDTRRLEIHQAVRAVLEDRALRRA